MSHWKVIGSWFIVLLLVCQADAQSTGMLSYPSLSNINMAEGTVEFWYQPMYDTKPHLPSTKKYDGLAAMFQFQSEYGGLSILHFAGAATMPSAGVWTSMGSRRYEIHPVNFGKFVPERGAWHHFALVWKGNWMRTFLDGKAIGERTHPVDLDSAYGVFGAQPLRFGDKYHRRGRFVIDEFRVSNIARDQKELGYFGQLKPDPFTRILDDFEYPFEPDGKTHTKPAVIFSGKGGLPTKQCQFVPGRFGNGMSLFRSPTP